MPRNTRPTRSPRRRNKSTSNDPTPQPSSNPQFAYILIPANEETTRSPSPTLNAPPPEANRSSKYISSPTNPDPIDWNMIPSLAPFVEYICSGSIRLNLEQQRVLLDAIACIDTDLESGLQSLRTRRSDVVPGKGEEGEERDREPRLCGFRITAEEERMFRDLGDVGY